MLININRNKLGVLPLSLSIYLPLCSVICTDHLLLDAGKDMA